MPGRPFGGPRLPPRCTAEWLLRGPPCPPLPRPPSPKPAPFRVVCIIISVLFCQSVCARWAGLLISSPMSPSSRACAVLAVSRCLLWCSSRSCAMDCACVMPRAWCSVGASPSSASSSRKRTAFSSSSGRAFRGGGDAALAGSGSSAAGSWTGYILASSWLSFATFASNIFTSCCTGVILVAAPRTSVSPLRSRPSSSAKSDWLSMDCCCAAAASASS
mmetsp:Transcript_9338/g.24091  ORF Transcript_9338/g.24091 Transcript_9338/m.24091 type:complete len:218 (-) Transcript_9338:345-998(-)